MNPPQKPRAKAASGPLTHFDAAGQAHMVDVGAKAETARVARAGGHVRMAPATFALIKSGSAKKGDVLGIARIAAIQAAKRTSDLIPLCHPLALIRGGTAKKGDVIGVARIAAIQAAKRTSELIPLCHPLPLTRVAVSFRIDEAASAVHIEVQAETVGKTGVEMEALTAVQVGLLTIYDMCKAADRGMVIEGVRLLEKHGGKSGSFIAGD